MAKRFCRIGQRLDASVADKQQRVVAEARKLAKFKKDDVDTSVLIQLKSDVKTGKTLYNEHAKACDTCEV